MKGTSFPIAAVCAALLSAGALVRPAPALAACGATDRTWQGNGGGTNANWSKAASWSGSNVPDSSAENAIIVSTSTTPNSQTTVTVGCVDIQSGFLNTTTGITITVTGDYFNNPTAGALTVAAGSTWKIVMAGTAAQTFTNNDTINYLDVTNNGSVTFDEAFSIRNTLSLLGSGTTLNVNADLTLLDSAAALTIPSGTTVIVGSGATLTALGGVTISGTLQIQAGSTLLVGSGETIQVNAGGALVLNGATGNVAAVDGYGGATYGITVAGSLDFNYFRVSRVDATGVSVTGTITRMQNGNFHYLAANGYAVTLGAAATLPSTMNGLGFFNESSNSNVQSFNASAYNSSSVTLDSWSGIGGPLYDNDPNAKLSWGTEAPTTLILTENTASGNPPSTIAPATGPSLFATFGFALNRSDTATNVTSVTFTLDGTASSSDIDYIQVYKDTNSNCTYEAGTDTQVGSNLTMTGSPPEATATFSTGDVAPSGTTVKCAHVLLRTSAIAAAGRTIALQVASTDDIVNSVPYQISNTSPPPLSAGTSTTTGSAASTWTGGQNTSFSTNNNWNGGAAPTSTADCVIGAGERAPVLTATSSCRNMTLQSGGTVSWNGGSHELAAYGTLTIESSYTFTSATSGSIALRGSTNQGVSSSTTFPGNLTIANTGTAPSNVVTINTDATFNGTLTLSSGTLSVAAGKTLTIGGNVTIASGATLEVQPGATLALGNGAVLTVSSGGTLSLVGTSTLTSAVTSTSTSNAYTVVVNGTLKAQYYSFSRLGTNGVTVNSGATIDSTYHLQNGSFSYPVPSGATFLRLYRQVPTNTMDNMSFDSGGSSATGTTNIYTDGSIASGTLTVTTYAGSLAGPAYDNDTSYLLSWSGATNTIDLTQQATGPSSLSQGTTYVMGRYGFKQTLAGASFSDTDITSIKLTLTGTGNANDVSQVRIYYSAGCSSSGGTLLASGTFSGNPATKTFSGLSGATVEASASSPPTRCIYVEYDIASDATNANTLGVKINSSADVVNSQSYAISGSTPPPVTLGSPGSVVGSTTTWTGTSSTDWCAASNWNGGVPTSSLNCVINSATNNPVISGTCGGTTAVCRSVTIGTGTLTLSGAVTLEVYGSFTNTGTFSSTSGTLRFRDDGSTATNQTVSSGTTVGDVTFTKTAGGTAKGSGTSLTVGSLNLPSGSSFTWQVPDGQTLTSTEGVTLTAGTFDIQSGGTLALANGTSITVNGGTFKASGTNDAYPQTTTNKAKVTASGSGRWGLTATSGTVDLTGFILDSIDTSGLNLGGTVALANLNGGQFTNLSTSYSSVKVIQFNTSGSLPTTATNVGFNWGAANSVYTAPPSPAPGDGYLLFYSTGCGGQSISFDQWFGDFQLNTDNPTPAAKTSATNCTITAASSASPVALMSLQATGYDGAVSVDWTTGSELDHAGFNVYRSAGPGGGYVQVNPSLIRNYHSSTLMHGNYRYVDQDVENGKTYFYLLEDVATNGSRETHGPVSAVPRAGAGSPPASGSGVNAGGSASGAGAGNGLGATGAVAAPGREDLGNGVHVLARTRRALRLEIIPPAASFATSAWNAAYETLSLPGYSPSFEPGKPALPERVVLVEVDADLTAASLGGSSIQEAAPSTHKIEPAPSWATGGGGTLVPSYSADAAAYASSAQVPGSYFTLEPSLVSVGGRRYVKLRVTPFQYRASTDELKRATRITLDIGLDGAAWSAATPAAPPDSASPSAAEGVLRIRYSATGMYQLAYDDLVAAGVDGPFAGADTSQLRLYLKGTEVPLEVFSATGSFASGDALRFYAVHDASLEDDGSEIVLSRGSLVSGAGAPLRIPLDDADPAGLLESDEYGTLRRAVAEQDVYPMFEGPLGEGIDHLFWARLWAEKGATPTSDAYLDIPIDLPGLLRGGTAPARLRVHVKGGPGFATNPTHHLGVRVNNVPFLVADAAFDTQEATTLRLEIPAAFLLPGENLIRLEVLGDLVPDGDWDFVYVDRIELDYRAARTAVDGIASITNYRLDTALRVGGFSNPASIAVYDVTDPADVRALDIPAPSSPDGGTTWEVLFAARPGPSGRLGRRFLAFEPSALPRPTALVLGRGAARNLKDPANGADLIVAGPLPLLTAAGPLVDARRAQGLRVVLAPLEQIYAEFTDGIRSSRALGGLIRHARASWAAPAPRYLLILGDATYDPRGRLGLGAHPGTPAAPIPILRGLYADFGSDDAFAVDEDSGSSLPALAVGRIPASSPGDIAAFVGKILDYESSDRAPEGDGARRLVFVSDRDSMGEGFASSSDSLAAGARAARSELTATRIDRLQAGTDAATRGAILDAFAGGPLAITYVGHGAEDRWAGASVFVNADASSLANDRLPIVLALNCLNAYFYDADPAYVSLGEKLVLNPDGGAIAFLGSTTMTLPPAQLALARAFFDQLASATRVPDTGDARLGDLILRAKHALGDDAYLADTLRSYVLIGDPSTKLPAATFAAAVAPSAPAPDEEEESGGFLSCATVSGPGAGGGGPGPGAVAELLVLAAVLAVSRRAFGASDAKGVRASEGRSGERHPSRSTTVTSS